jgi:hypothetical protein
MYPIPGLRPIAASASDAGVASQPEEHGQFSLLETRDTQQMVENIRVQLPVATDHALIY